MYKICIEYRIVLLLIQAWKIPGERVQKNNTNVQQQQQQQRVARKIGAQWNQRSEICAQRSSLNLRMLIVQNLNWNRTKNIEMIIEE